MAVMGHDAGDSVGNLLWQQRLGRFRLALHGLPYSSRRYVISSVSAVPGPIMLTRTRRDSSPCRGASANPITPNFVMLQTLIAGLAIRRVVELIVTRSAAPRGEPAAAHQIRRGG